jgi:hypothetical protein
MIISGDNFHFVLVAIDCNFEICIVLVRVIKMIYSHILPVSNCSSGEGFALVIQGASQNMLDHFHVCICCLASFVLRMCIWCVGDECTFIFLFMYLLMLWT